MSQTLQTMKKMTHHCWNHFQKVLKMRVVYMAIGWLPMAFGNSDSIPEGCQNVPTIGGNAVFRNSPNHTICKPALIQTNKLMCRGTAWPNILYGTRLLLGILILFTNICLLFIIYFLLNLSLCQTNILLLSLSIFCLEIVLLRQFLNT